MSIFLTDETRRLIETDPDFVNLKRFNYSLTKTLERYPDGAPEHIVAKALGMTEQEVEQVYQQVIQKMRVAMKVDET